MMQVVFVVMEVVQTLLGVIVAVQRMLGVFGCGVRGDCGGAEDVKGAWMWCKG